MLKDGFYEVYTKAYGPDREVGDNNQWFLLVDPLGKFIEETRLLFLVVLWVAAHKDLKKINF